MGDIEDEGPMRGGWCWCGEVDAPQCGYPLFDQRTEREGSPIVYPVTDETLGEGGVEMVIVDGCLFVERYVVDGLVAVGPGLNVRLNIYGVCLSDAQQGGGWSRMWCSRGTGSPTEASSSAQPSTSKSTRLKRPGWLWSRRSGYGSGSILASRSVIPSRDLRPAAVLLPV